MKATFDIMVGTLKYEMTLSSVKAWGMFDITSLVVNNLGGKKSTSGKVPINGFPAIGSVSTDEGYNVFYNVDLKDSWDKIVGKVDVTSKAIISTDIEACMVKDDAVYDSEEVPVPPEPPAPEKDEFARAKMHTTKQEVADWPVVSTLTAMYITKLKIRLDVDDATRAKWPRDTSINVHCLLKRNGVWHAGPCDFVHPLPSYREYGCLCVPDGDNRTYNPDPMLDDKLGIVITPRCRHTLGKERFRSTICWIDLPK